MLLQALAWPQHLLASSTCDASGTPQESSQRQLPHWGLLRPGPGVNDAGRDLDCGRGWAGEAHALQLGARDGGTFAEALEQVGDLREEGALPGIDGMPALREAEFEGGWIWGGWRGGGAAAAGGRA